MDLPPDSPNWALDDMHDDEIVIQQPEIPNIQPLMSIPFHNNRGELSVPVNQNKQLIEVILPKALEDVLAFKDLRELELGDEEPAIQEEQYDDEYTDPIQNQNSTAVISSEYADVDADSDDDEFFEVTAIRTTAQGKNDKNRRKKKRKKQNRQKRKEETRNGEHKVGTEDDDKVEDDEKPKVDENANVFIEYVPEKITIAELAPMYRQFYRVFELFKIEDKPSEAKLLTNVEKIAPEKKTLESILEDDDDDEELEEVRKILNTYLKLLFYC